MKMRRGTFLLLLQLCLLATAQNTPGESRQTSYQTQLYRISSKQTEQILKKGIEEVDETYFQELAFQYPSDSLFDAEIPYGNYLKTKAVQNDIVFELFIVSNVELRVMNNGTDLNIVVFDLGGVEVRNAEVLLDNKKLKYDELTSMYRLKRNNGDGIVIVNYEGVSSYFGLEKSIRYSKFRRSFNSVMYSVPLKYVAVPVSLVIKSPIDLYKSVKRLRPSGIFYYIQKPFSDIVRTARWGEPHGFIRPLVCMFNDDHCKGNRDAKGFVALNKPKYRPSDTVRFKAYITNHKDRLFKKELEVWIGTGWYLNRKFSKRVATITPYQPGFYESSFVLNDSLKLKLDQGIRLFLVNRYETVITTTFDYEDYVLEKANFSMSISNDKIQQGDSVVLTLEGKDSNGMNLPDAKVELQLFPRVMNELTTNSLFVESIMWQISKSLESSSATSVTIPSSIFPNADIEYEVIANFQTTDYEVHQVIKKLHFELQKPEIEYSLVGDSLKIALKMGDSSLVSSAQIQVSTNGKVLETKSIDLPNYVLINPLASKYVVNTKSVSKEIGLNELPSEVDVYVNRDADSIHVQLINPRKIALRYYLYKGNKEILRGSGETINLDFKTRTSGNYFLSIQYMWAGKAYDRNYVLALETANLNVATNLPTLIYPGKEQEVRISVTDFKGRPVQGADITAFGLKSQFKQTSTPELPNFNEKGKDRKLINNFDISSAVLDKNVERIALNWQNWNARMTLDSIAYYRFIYPEDGIYQHSIAAPDSLTQFAPFVVEDGEIQPVHIIYVDEIPVFFSMTDHQQPYSFLITKGYHHLRLRTNTKEIEVDSILFEKGTKTVISIDINSKNKLIKQVEVPYQLTVGEKRLAKLYLARIDQLTTNNYLEQDGTVFWNPLRRNDALIGPIRPNRMVNYVVKGDDPLRFYFEPAYQYSINDTYIKMKALNFDNLTFRNIQTSLSDYVLTEDDIVAFWEKMQVNQQARFTYHDYPKESVEGNGSVAFWNPYPDKLRPKNYLVFKESDPSFIRVYGGREPVFHDLVPEVYHAFVLLENNDFIECRNLTIKPDGTLYVALDSISIQSSDSVSRHFNEVIHKNVLSTYYSNSGVQQNFNQLKSIYNSTRRSTGLDHDVVSGTVTDESGEGLPGVNVVIKGTTVGVTTDLDGRYQISAPADAVLVFSSVGMLAQEMVVGGRSYLDLAMMADVKQLQEIVITGYGVENKKDFTSAVSSWSEAIKGKVSGVRINGNAGGGINIIVRGQGSLSSNSPLYVVDGVPYDGRELDVTPDDIASMEILKGEQAIGLYGSRAAGGVVIISLNKDSKAKKLIDEQVMDLSTFPDISQANPFRRNFSDYAFWQPRITTDANGQASFKVTFPDDVTSWKTNFLAIKKNKQSGFDQEEVKSFKPVMGTLSVPRFLILGDSAQLIGRVLNYTADTLSITSYFEWGEQEQIQKSSLIKSRMDSIYVTASSLDSLDVTYRMRTDAGYEDGELRTIPVLSRGVKETRGIFKVMNKPEVLSISADSLMGAVTIRAEGNMLGVLFDEIEKIADYPHACNEQTASKLIALLTEQTIRSHYGQTFEHTDEIERHIRRLEKSANKAGLWGWWTEGTTINWISKHVLSALLLARKNGYNVTIKNQSFINELVGNFDQRGQNKVEALELLHLLDAKIDFPAYINSVDIQDLSLEQQFRLIRLNQEFGMSYTLDSLWSNKQETIFGGLYWKMDELWAYRNSNLLTVLALEILNGVDSLETERQAIMNYLLSERKSGQWRNTYESARILAAIAPSLTKKSEDVKPASLLITGDMEKKVSDFPFEQKAVLTDGLNFEKTGSGPVYLTVYKTGFNATPERVETDFVVNTSFSKAGSLIKGEQVLLKVNLEVKRDAEYIMLEIPIPAGTNYQDKPKGSFPEVHREYYMDRVTIFYTNLPAGDYEVGIPLIPRYSGTYSLNPARVELMYFPTKFGREGLKSVQIR